MSRWSDPDDKQKSGHQYADGSTVCSLCGFDNTGVKKIANMNDLCMFAANVKRGVSQYAVLTDDITIDDDAQWQQYGPVGTQSTNPYTDCEFDGQGHVITFAVTDSSTPHNLFGAVKNATISNLCLTGELKSDTPYMAPLVNYVCGDQTDIHNCYSNVYIDSQINGDGSHGGFVAVNQSKFLNFKDCQFDGIINVNGDASKGSNKYANGSCNRKIVMNGHIVIMNSRGEKFSIAGERIK